MFFGCCNKFDMFNFNFIFKEMELRYLSDGILLIQFSKINNAVYYRRNNFYTVLRSIESCYFCNNVFLSIRFVVYLGNKILNVIEVE